MGLDMYLYRKEYVSTFAWSQDERAVKEANLHAVIANHFNIDPSMSGIYVDYCVAYWRKANAIHGWFVNELGNGVDECQEIYVPREKLVELRELCASVIKQPAMAGDILPPQDGFFFGSGEIDEWYLNDMQLTIDIIDKVLSAIPEDDYGWSFSYRASW